MPKQCHISTLALFQVWHMRYYMLGVKGSDTWDITPGTANNTMLYLKMLSITLGWHVVKMQKTLSESVKRQELICHIPWVLSTFSWIYHLRQHLSQWCSKVRKRCGVYEKWTLLHLSPSAPIFSGWNQTIPYNKIPSRTTTLAHVCSQGGTKGEALRQALPSADSLS